MRHSPHEGFENAVHVLILPSWYPVSRDDVAGSFFREQAQALQRAGCRVGVLAPLYRSLWRLTRCPGGLRSSSFEDDNGVPTVRVPILNVFPRLVRLEAWNTIRLLKRPYDDYVRRFGRPDIVHLHSLLPAGEFARWLERTRRVPFVVTEHSTAYGRRLVPRSRLRRATLIAMSAGRRIAVSSPFSELLSVTLGPEGGSWIQIPNIVSDQFFRQSPVLPRPSDRGVFVMLGIGTLEPKKRFDLTLRAFAIAFSGDPRYQLRIGGAGPERNRLESLAASLGIASRVMFLGKLPRDAVAREMAAASAFVLSSDIETFGVVLIEALAAGLPIIATACGGPEDIVNGSNGLLVPPDDVAAMVSALRHVATNIDNYDPRVIAAECAERFGERTITSSLKAIYDDVCAESRLSSARHDFDSCAVDRVSHDAAMEPTP